MMITMMMITMVMITMMMIMTTIMVMVMKETMMKAVIMLMILWTRAKRKRKLFFQDNQAATTGEAGHHQSPWIMDPDGDDQ